MRMSISKVDFTEFDNHDKVSYLPNCAKTR
jgi:hypothetical protein